MPYIAPPKEDPNYKGQYNYVWVQKATATKPAAFIYELWGEYGNPSRDKFMTAAQKKKWKDFKFPRNNFKSTVAAYKKKGFVEVKTKDIVKLFKDYVPRSYAAALKSKKINPKSKYSFVKDGSDWAESYAPIDLIYDKTSVNSVYNKFLKSMTWGGKNPRKDYKDSPASYFWGWGRPLDFKDGWHSVIPMVYGSDTVVLHNYQTGKVAVVTECEGDDDEARYYGMSPVAFEWKLNPKLLAAMNKPAVKPKAKPTAKAPVRKPAAKPRKTTTNKVMTKAEAKKKFIAVAQPYWIKHLTSIKQMFQKEEKKYPEEYEDYGELPSKQADKYLKMAKSGRLRALETLREYSDLIPAGFYHLINYDRNDYDTWKTSAEYFEGPKATAKQLKSLLPFIEGKVTKTVVKPKPKPRAKAPAKKPVAKPRAKAKPAIKPKYYLHFGEDYTADKCPYTGKKFAMNTIRSAKALANHIFNLGPMPNMSPGYAEFTIDGEHYGNMAYSRLEIIEAKTGEVVDYWRPSKEQKSAYKKKANAIKKAAKTAAKKPTAKPRAKAPVKKTVAKPKARPSPSQSAAATKVGTRKRGNDGFMWEVKKNKNGVHRWARDTKSTKRAEDYWYWKV